MRELGEVLRRAERRLGEVRESALASLAALECEAWLFDAPAPFEGRMGGRHAAPEPARAWAGEQRHAWLRLRGAAPGQAEGGPLALRLNLEGELLAVDAEGRPLCGLSAGAEPYAGVLALDDEAGEGVELWLRAELEPGVGVRCAADRPAAELCRVQPNLYRLSCDMEVLIDLARALGECARRDIIGRALQRALSVLTDLNEERALAAIYALLPELERTSGDYGFALSAVGRVRVGMCDAQSGGAARRFARLTASALRLMEGCDGYVAGAGRAQLYDWLLSGEPELFERVRERVGQGRWEIQGALWAEPDLRTTGGESIARQLLYGKRFYARAFGLDVSALWLEDSPGCCAQLPQLMRRSGIQYLVCGRAARPADWEFPHTSFWLQGQDGSRVLAHVPAAGDAALPGDVLAAERGCGELGLVEGALMTYGAPDEGPGRAQMERLERMAELRGLPPVRRERAIDFLERLRRSRVELPGWSGELCGGGELGALTSGVRLHRLGRRLECALRLAELVLTAMQLRGADYPRTELEALWQRALTWQACRGADGEARLREGEALIAELHALTQRSWNGEGGLDVVLNPHAWTIDMWLPGDADCGPDEALRVSLPPMSASSTIGARRAQLPRRAADERALENDRLALRFDERGRLASVRDLRQGWEVLRGAGNQLNVYGDDGDARELGGDALRRRAGAFAQVSARGEVEGAVCRRVAEYRFGESSVEQTVEITAGSARIDFITRVRWREPGRLLRAEFPLNVSAGRFRCDAPFGSVERPAHRNTARDQALAEAGALGWADLSQTGRGAALMLDGGYGYGCADNVLSVSLVRSAGEDGARVIELRYALYPHAGDIVDATRQACAFRQPPQLAQGPTFGPLCWVDARNVVLETVKLAEDSADVVLRMYECMGASCTARLRTGFEAQAASVCDLLERVTAPLAIDGEDIVLEFAPYEIKTVAITPRRRVR